MQELIHVTTAAAWQAAQQTGRIELGALDFIHLCTPAQLPFVLDRHFRVRSGLIALWLDPTGLDVRWEESEPGMPPFPHLYQPLPTATVLRIAHP